MNNKEYIESENPYFLEIKHLENLIIQYSQEIIYLKHKMKKLILANDYRNQNEINFFDNRIKYLEAKILYQQQKIKETFPKIEEFKKRKPLMDQKILAMKGKKNE